MSGDRPRARDVASMLRWLQHPAAMVRELFKVEPDPWQVEVLEVFPTSKGRRIAMPASKGPGKTAVEAWLIWNFLLTRPEPKVAATSVTSDNLRDNLWAELAKWQHRSPLLTSAFQWGKERIVLKEKPETHFATARTWSQSADAQQQSETLAGLHADYLLFVLDESGGIPDAVMAAAEGALATGKECHILQGGNTLRREGPLYRACTVERDLWHVVRINGDPDDPKRSPRVDMQWAREQISKYGRDNPWVLVNVFGQFPPSSLNVLIGPDEIAAAEKRSYREHDIAYAPRVLGVDVAREGDDASVMFPRQGLVMFEPSMWRNINSIQGAGHVARKIQDWGADACFVDNTGGFGAGWIDNLRMMGHAPIAVHYAGEPNDRRYYNKRAEMYFELVEWIKQGGQLPHVAEMTQALTSMTYTFKGDRFLLEDKRQLKDRLGFSPDHADAAAQTFAQVIGPRRAAAVRENRGFRFKSDYNPYQIRSDEIMKG